jgi:hypothetical protein
MSINRAVRDLVFTPLELTHGGTTASEFIAQRFALGISFAAAAPRHCSARSSPRRA